jgi:hypothetical protein
VEAVNRVTPELGGCRSTAERLPSCPAGTFDEPEKVGDADPLEEDVTARLLRDLLLVGVLLVFITAWML